MADGLKGLGSAAGEDPPGQGRAGGRSPGRRRGAEQGAAEAQDRRKAEGGKTPAPPKAEPDGKAQRNFTDPESRILKTRGYIQGYNALRRRAGLALWW